MRPSEPAGRPLPRAHPFYAAGDDGATSDPPIRARFTDDPGEIPDWWAPFFYHRQRALRALVLRHVGRSPLGMMLPQIQQDAWHYATREIVHALAALADSGLIEVFERTVRVEGQCCIRESTDLYFVLKGGPDVEA